MGLQEVEGLLALRAGQAELVEEHAAAGRVQGNETDEEEDPGDGDSPAAPEHGPGKMLE
jgi:hypothetical protein